MAELDVLIDSGNRPAALALLRQLQSRYPRDAALYRSEARLYADRDPSTTMRHWAMPSTSNGVTRRRWSSISLPPRPRATTSTAFFDRGAHARS
jgi:hypothetical protein